MLFKVQFLLVLTLAFSVGVVGQNIITVNKTPDTEADYKSLQQAVDAANNGDYIYVQPSTSSYGDVTINKEVHIIGRSHSLEGYITRAGTFKLLENSDDTSIEGFRCDIDASENTGSNKLADIRNCFLGNGTNYNTVKNIVFQGNVIETPTTISLVFFSLDSVNIGFENNVIYGGGVLIVRPPFGMFSFKNNIFATGNVSFDSGDSLLGVTDCIFVTRQSDSEFSKVFLSIGEKGEIQMKNCVTYNYNSSMSYDFEVTMGDENNFKKTNCFENANPQFVKVSTSGNSVGNNGFDPDNDDLHLRSNTPVSSAGVYGQ